MQAVVAVAEIGRERRRLLCPTIDEGDDGQIAGQEFVAHSGGVQIRLEQWVRAQGGVVLFEKIQQRRPVEYLQAGLTEDMVTVEHDMRLNHRIQGTFTVMQNVILGF